MKNVLAKTLMIFALSASPVALAATPTPPLTLTEINTSQIWPTLRIFRITACMHKQIRLHFRKI